MMGLKIIFKKGFLLQAFRFGIVGILNTIVGFVFYILFINFNFHYIIALFFSHVIGVTNSFFWNKFWTFKSKQKSLKELFRFITVYAITFLLNIVILFFLVEKMYFDKKLSQLISLSLITIISFCGHKYWSFKNYRINDQ